MELSVKITFKALHLDEIEKDPCQSFPRFHDHLSATFNGQEYEFYPGTCVRPFPLSTPVHFVSFFYVVFLLDAKCASCMIQQRSVHSHSMRDRDRRKDTDKHNASQNKSFFFFLVSSARCVRVNAPYFVSFVFLAFEILASLVPKFSHVVLSPSNSFV